MIKNIENVIAKSSENGISRIIIDHPKSYNSLSEKTIKSLIQVFNYYNKDEKTKVIIVEGSGKGFSAGHNLKEIQSLKKKNKYQNIEGIIIGKAIYDGNIDIKKLSKII